MRIIYKERIEGDTWKQRVISFKHNQFQLYLIDVIDEELDAETGAVRWAYWIWSTGDITNWFKNKFDKLMGRGLYAKN
jgi:hypothetical protein